MSPSDWVPLGNRASSPGTTSFRIPHRSRCFGGHFEGAPILPGVTHLALAMAASEGDNPSELAGLRDVRFNHPILPGDEIDVQLAERADPSTRYFQIWCRGRLASSGVLILRPEGDAPDA